MVKYRKYIYLALSLLMAVIAAGGIYYYLQELEAQARQTERYREVVVAAEDVEADEVLEEEMLSVKEVPVAYAHSDARREKEELVGSITRAPIWEDEQILPANLVQEGEDKDEFAYLVSSGKRAVSVAINEVIGVGYLLTPGDRVDVIATLEEEDDGDYVDYTKIIVQNVKVLSVGSNFDPLQYKEATEQASTVTLEVDPEEAPPLVLAEERGTIRLLLRSPIDEEDAPDPKWRMEDY